MGSLKYAIENYRYRTIYLFNYYFNTYIILYNRPLVARKKRVSDPI